MSLVNLFSHFYKICLSGDCERKKKINFSFYLFSLINEIQYNTIPIPLAFYIIYTVGVCFRSITKITFTSWPLQKRLIEWKTQNRKREKKKWRKVKFADNLVRFCFCFSYLFSFFFIVRAGQCFEFWVLSFDQLAIAKFSLCSMVNIHLNRLTSFNWNQILIFLRE